MCNESKKTVGDGPLLVMAVILAVAIFPAPLLLICTISMFFRVLF